MKQKEKDEHFAAHIPGVLQYHQLMLGDETRNRLLARAIEQYVTPHTTFLDIGAGTGVWAILAAKLGANRVVAVEIEECLIPIIHKHAQENGVAGRIEIIHGKSDDVKIKGKFDLVVSELFGNEAFGTDTVNSFIDVRTRFLAPGGVLIPQKLTMFAVPARVAGSVHDVPAGVPIKSEFLKTLKLNYMQNLPRSERDRVEFLAEPQELVQMDFQTITKPPTTTNLTASWKLKDISKANGIAIFNRSTFTDEIEMDSTDSQSWGMGVYEFTPFEKQSGELQISLTIDAQNGNWTLSIPTNPAVRPQTYSPVFAFTRVRMAQQMTPHRKFKAPKKATP
ncbi:hypothetical protein BH10ACI3_BH10ACI3_05120 [soil metagenome]